MCYQLVQKVVRERVGLRPGAAVTFQRSFKKAEYRKLIGRTQEHDTTEDGCTYRGYYAWGVRYLSPKSDDDIPAAAEHTFRKLLQ